MGQLVVFLIVLGISWYLAWSITRSLGIHLDTASCFVAMLVAAATGLTWFVLTAWWGVFTRPRRPQTVVLETRETPMQVVRRALLAAAGIIIVIGAIVGVMIYCFPLE